MDLTFGLDVYLVQLIAWFLVYGLAAIVSCCWYWVRKGKAKRVVYGLVISLWIVSFLLLIASLFAIQQGKSTDAWFAFTLPGLLGGSIALSSFFAFRKRYEQAESKSSQSRIKNSTRS